jgi:Ca-activated chloride channel family protein
MGQGPSTTACKEMTMSSQRTLAAAASALLLALMPVAHALADGFIVIERPIPIPRPRPGPIPIPPRIAYFPLEVKNHNVTCDIRDTVGTTKIDQVFHNPNNVQMEGTYLFPLPETASVQKFSMWMNGKEVHGELLDAAKARATYEDIVRRMRDPALLEYVGGRVYRARVFPIPANGDVRIALQYDETIGVNDGLATYRYPLNTEKFSAKDIEDVTIVVNIKSPIPLKSVFCPSHNATVSRPNDREARVGFEAHHVKPDQDFIVHYQMSEKEFGLSLLTFRPAGEDGFFMARIAPPIDVSAQKIIPKDVCFVFDTSGSMAGEKIAQAKRAMTFCLSSLRPEDRFNIISFATETRPFRETLVPATRENIDAAKTDVERVEAAGGTNINEALLAAIKARANAEDERPYMIVFITDGEPTVDERDPAKIQANVKKANEGRCRLFVFGVGHDLNTKLLDRLAEDNRGAREYIHEKEDIEVKISSFFKKVSDPVLSDIALRFGGADAFDVYPRQLPDLFHGGELVVLGRYRTPGRHNVAMSGTRAGRSMTWAFQSTLADSGTENDFLPRLWATRKIGYLMDEIRLHGETNEVKDEIIRLAKRYAIITPYTSYLVVEDTTGVARAGAAPAARALREYAAKDGTFMGAMKSAEGYTHSSRGPVAVRGSEEARAMQQAARPEGGRFGAGGYGGMMGGYDGASAGQPTGPQESVIRIVGTKTFYLDNGRWTDSEYDGKAATKKVKAFSDDYFKLLRTTPELGKYLALGGRILVVLRTAAYEVVE